MIGTFGNSCFRGRTSRTFSTSHASSRKHSDVIIYRSASSARLQFPCFVKGNVQHRNWSRWSCSTSSAICFYVSISNFGNLFQGLRDKLSSVIAPELSTCSSGNSSKSFFNSKREICRRRFVGEKKVELNDSLSSDRNPITLQEKEGNESRVTGACVLNAFMQMLDFYHNFRPFIHVVGIRKFIPFQMAHIRGNFA